MVRDHLTAIHTYKGKSMEVENNGNVEQLQSDQQIETQDDNQFEVENPEQQQGADSATAGEPEHQENTDDVVESEVNQDAVNKAINKQHAKYREEQRKRIELEKKLEQLQIQQVDANKPPPIPELPSQFDDDYEQKLKDRDAIVRQHVMYEQEQNALKARTEESQRAQALQQQQETLDAVQKYNERITKLNVDPQKLAQAGQTLQAYGLSAEIADYIIRDDKGPLITTALAADPATLSEVALMPPTQAILHIERNVRSKLNIQPRTSNASAPAKRVASSGKDVSAEYPLTGGKVTVE